VLKANHPWHADHREIALVVVRPPAVVAGTMTSRVP